VQQDGPEVLAPGEPPQADICDLAVVQVDYERFVDLRQVPEIIIRHFLTRGERANRFKILTRFRVFARLEQKYRSERTPSAGPPLDQPTLLEAPLRPGAAVYRRSPIGSIRGVPGAPKGNQEEE
jgi:hypothetical protein